MDICIVFSAAKPTDCQRHVRYSPPNLLKAGERMGLSKGCYKSLFKHAAIPSCFFSCGASVQMGSVGAAGAG